MTTSLSSRPFLAALVLLVVAGCTSSTPLRHTEATPYDVVVARFLLDVEGLDAGFPDPGSGLIPVGVRVVQDARDVIEAGRTVLSPEGSAYAGARDSAFAAVADALGWQAGLRLLPLETLRGEVPYLVGAPLGSAEDVAGRAALEVEATVEVPDAGQASWSVLGTGRARVSGHPEVTMSVRMLDAAGDLVWRDRVRVRSRERVTLDERWLLAVRTSREAGGGETLPDLLREAAHRLAQRSQRG
jgi:hypothetical protein